MKKLPFFKYNPNAYTNGSIVNKPNVCDCCHQTTEYYVENMYSAATVKCVCVECIHSGLAAEIFNGDFIQYSEVVLENKENTEILFKRTPGYSSWQGEHWLVCCNDYCAFIKPIGAKELHDMKIFQEVTEEYAKKYNLPYDDFEDLSETGSPGGYLFQCLHSKKHHLDVDFD